MESFKCSSLVSFIILLILFVFLSSSCLDGGGTSDNDNSHGDYESDTNNDGDINLPLCNEPGKRVCLGSEVQTCTQEGEWAFYRDCSPECCIDGLCESCETNGDIDNNENTSEDGDVDILESNEENEYVDDDFDINTETDFDTSDNADGDYEISDNDADVSSDVIIIDDETMAASRIENGELIIPEEVKGLPGTKKTNINEIKTGKIVVSGLLTPERAGLLKRVGGVYEENGEIHVVLTEEASLAHVFNNASINIQDSVNTNDFTLPFIDTTKTHRDGFGISDNDFALTCTGGSSIEAEVNYGVEFTPDFNFEIDYGWGGLDNLEASISGNFRAYAELGFAASVNGSCSSGDPIEIWSASRDFLQYVGGVPVTERVKARLLMGWEISASGSANASAGVEASANLEMGIHYNGDDWSGNANADFDFTQYGPTITLDLGARGKVFFVVEVETKVYSIAGPIIKAEPGVELEIDKDNTKGLIWNLNFVNHFNAGCIVEILDHELYNWESDPILPSTHLLMNGCVKGECCNNLQFKNASQVCNDQYNTNYRCNPTGCGGQPQKQAISRYCSGDAATCIGDTQTGNWVNNGSICSEIQKCNSTTNSSYCSSDPSCSTSCDSHEYYSCVGNDVYWFDSCDTQESIKEDCGTSGYENDPYCSSGDVWDTYVTRSCSGSTCTSNSANEKIEDCGTDGCSNGECNEPVSCHIEVSPSLNTWNSDYVPLSDCECETDDDCRAIYRARTTSISGNTATMEFKKANSGGSMPAVHYWLAVSPENACKDLEVYSTRTDGTWSSSSTTKSFSFSVWPSQSAFENASSNESKSFFLITGGSGGYENEKLWFQRNVVTFTKICD